MLKPGKLYQLCDNSKRIWWEFAGFNADNKVEWTALRRLDSGTYVMAVESFTLSPDNFVASRQPILDSVGASARQAAIMASCTIEAVKQTAQLRYLFQNGSGIPGYKFLHKEGLLWISNADIEVYGWDIQTK